MADTRYDGPSSVIWFRSENKMSSCCRFSTVMIKMAGALASGHRS